MRPLTIIMVLVVMIIFIMGNKKRDYFHVDVYDASDVKITSQQTLNMSECLNLAISTKNIWLKQKFQLLMCVGRKARGLLFWSGLATIDKSLAMKCIIPPTPIIKE